ncbi:hypothetical protein RFI_03439, partial [Reticulomyxa filosa]
LIQVFVCGIFELVNKFKYSMDIQVFDDISVVNYDSNVICSGSLDNTIRFWDIRSNKNELFIIHEHKKENYNGILTMKIIKRKNNIHLCYGSMNSHIYVLGSANSNTEQGNEQQQAKTGKPLYNELKRQQSATKFQDPITSSIASQDERYFEPIRVQYFRDVPIADLETVFPCKRLSLKTIDRIYFIMVVVLGMYYLIKEMFTKHTGTLWHHAILVGCAALVFRAVAWYRVLFDFYYYYIFIAYFALLQDSLEKNEIIRTQLYTQKEKGALATPEEVDKYCEKMLKDKFGAKIDIEINDSMKKLKALGLVEEKLDISNDSQPSLIVKPLREGIDCVHRHWMSFTSSFQQLQRIAATDTNQILEEKKIFFYLDFLSFQFLFYFLGRDKKCFIFLFHCFAIDNNQLKVWQVNNNKKFSKIITISFHAEWARFELTTR